MDFEVSHPIRCVLPGDHVVGVIAVIIRNAGP
jgi:hypothetical protein